jgi:hypothetical protein
LQKLSSIALLSLTPVVGLVGGYLLTQRLMWPDVIPGAIRYGAWHVWPRAGAPDADPYSRAVIARRGDVPMSPAEGLALFADRDSDGRPLVGSCDYEVIGAFPAARAWTMSIFSRDGRLLTGRSGRAVLTSAEAVADRAGYRILLSRDPQPGNWLPLDEAIRITMALRFYETPLSAVASALDATRLPQVRRLRCR